MTRILGCEAGGHSKLLPAITWLILGHKTKATPIVQQMEENIMTVVWFLLAIVCFTKILPCVLSLGSPEIISNEQYPGHFLEQRNVDERYSLFLSNEESEKNGCCQFQIVMVKKLRDGGIS